MAVQGVGVIYVATSASHYVEQAAISAASLREVMPQIRTCDSPTVTAKGWVTAPLLKFGRPCDRLGSVSYDALRR